MKKEEKMDIVKTEQLTKIYGEGDTAIAAVDGINLNIKSGEFLVAAINTSGFKVPYYFPWSGILATIVIGLVFGILAAIIPARQASRMEIIKALHYE